MKKEMIKQTLNDIAELIYEDEIKEAEASLEAYANQRVIDELYYIAEQGNFEFKAMGFVLASRVKELTGSNKLSKGD